MRCVGSGEEPEGEEEERSLGQVAARERLMETEQDMVTIAIFIDNMQADNSLSLEDEVKLINFFNLGHYINQLFGIVFSMVS